MTNPLILPVMLMMTAQERTLVIWALRSFRLEAEHPALPDELDHLLERLVKVTLDEGDVDDQ